MLTNDAPTTSQSVIDKRSTNVHQVMLFRRHEARAETRTHLLRVNRCIAVSEFQRSLSEFIQDLCDVVHTKC